VARFVNARGPSGWSLGGGFLLWTGQPPGSRFGDQVATINPASVDYTEFRDAFSSKRALRAKVETRGIGGAAPKAADRLWKNLLSSATLTRLQEHTVLTQIRAGRREDYG